MTMFYPDISNHQAPMDVSGIPVLCAKASEGTTFADPDYPIWKNQMAGNKFFFAYHFLHSGAIGAQSQWAFSIIRDTPAMLDLEPTGVSSPTLEEGIEFIDDYRALGGTCNMLYLPHWYWQGLGSQSLQPFIDRGMHLVSSNYTTYSDTGPGWTPYGGMTPEVWQYTSSALLDGKLVDRNAYKGSLADFIAMVSGTTPPPPTTWTEQMMNNLPTLRRGDTGEPVRTVQGLLRARHRKVMIDGDFGPLTQGAVKTFQSDNNIASDGVVGKDTWPLLVGVPGA